MKVGEDHVAAQAEQRIVESATLAGPTADVELPRTARQAEDRF